MNSSEENAGAGPELTPAQQAEYAALLAGYLSPGDPGEAVPSDVAARLDATLAELTAERRRAATAPESPASAGARLRRRRIGSALLAAAAVTVGGFAILPTVLDGRGDDAESADTAVSADAGAGASEDRVDAAPVPDSVPRVRRDRLEEDVVRIVQQDVVPTTSGQASAQEDSEGGEPSDGDDGAPGGPTYELRDSCVVPRLEGGATWLVVRYAGDLAVLVADPVDGPPPRTATLLPCAGGPAMAEVELPAG